MKKIYILLTVIIATLFVACSQQSLESKAKERIRPFMDYKIKQMEISSYDIQNETVVYSSDSICIIQFDAQLRSPYGEKESVPMEYILFWTPEVNVKDIHKEATLTEVMYSVDRNGIKPLQISVNEFLKDAPSADKIDYDKYLRLSASPQAMLRGREVKE